MHVAVLFNPIAGAGIAAQAAHAIVEALRAAGHDAEPLRSELAPIGGWLVPALDRADVVVVVGGDGAVRLASASAARTGTMLYHAPLGTENLFAREFGTMRDPLRIVADLATPVTRTVDLAEVEPLDDEDRPCGVRETFVLMASVGFDANVVHDLAAHRTGGIHHLSYVPPIVRQVATYRPPRISARTDGAVVLTERPGVAIIANSRQYARRLDPAINADMSDGRLDFVHFPAVSPVSLVTWTQRILRRRHLEHPDLTYARGAVIELRCEAPHHLQLDGDPVAWPMAVTAWRFSISERRLDVVIGTKLRAG